MKTTRAHDVATDHQLQSAIEKDLSDVKTITLGGKDMKPAGISAVFQDHIDAADEVASAKAALKAALDNEREKGATARAMAKSLQSYALARFGEGSPLLADFGIKSRRPRAKLKVVEKLVAVERMRATRAARHTMGPNKKKAIKGDAPVGPGPSPTNGSSKGGGTPSA
jgi:hypothetical protein